MATKRTIKKVDITSDDGVLDLKAKDKALAAFKVNKINYDFDEVAEDSFLEKEISEDIKTSSDEQAFENRFDANQLHQRMESFAEKLEKAVIKVAPNPDSETVASPKELIKVKFGKFVQLVASRDFLEVLEKNKDEELIMSSNLLTDLAGAVEERSEKKTPIIFVIGLAIGVIITYLLVNK